MKLKFRQDLKLEFGQYFAADAWLRLWNFILDADSWTFDIILKTNSLVSWTQPLGSLCLWQCLKHRWNTKTYSRRVCIRPEKWLKPGWACKWQREGGKATEEGDVGRSIPQFRWSSTIDNLHTHTPILHLQRKVTHSICACNAKITASAMGRVRQKQKSLQNFCRTTMAVGIVGKAHSLPNASLPAAVYCRKLPDNAWLHLSPDKTTLGFLSNTSQQSWFCNLICFSFVFWIADHG